jgi:hypothetical protein
VRAEGQWDEVREEKVQVSETVITAEMMQIAMENGMGPLVGDFESPELKLIHDTWVDGGTKIRSAYAALGMLLAAEACR